MASLSVICHPNDGKFRGGAKVSLDSTWDWGKCLANFQKASGGESISSTIDSLRQFDFFNIYQDMVMRPSSECKLSHKKCSLGCAIFFAICAISSSIIHQFLEIKISKFCGDNGEVFCCSLSVWPVQYQLVLSVANPSSFWQLHPIGLRSSEVERFNQRRRRVHFFGRIWFRPAWWVELSHLIDWRCFGLRELLIDCSGVFSSRKRCSERQ